VYGHTMSHGRLLKKLVAYSFAALMLLPVTAWAQQPAGDRISEQLKKTGQVDLANSKVRLLKADYTFEGKNVEAIIMRPMAEGEYPGLVLVPGYSRTAADYIPLGVRFAKAGYACMAITQPGFGKSEGEADFVGPRTIATLEAGIARFRNEPFVDPERIGIFGYSRGAMATSLLATRGIELQAAVFAAGIYDFQKAYDGITLEGIRENMKKEAGLSPAAVAARSSILRMSDLACPVLILHGQLDKNAPVDQALALREKLEQEEKEFELKIFPDKAHDMGMKNLLDATLPFLEKHLLHKDGSAGTVKGT